MAEEITDEDAARLAAVLATKEGLLQVEQKLAEAVKQTSGQTAAHLSMIDNLRSASGNLSNTVLQGTRQISEMLGQLRGFDDVIFTINRAKDAVVDFGAEGALALLPLLNALPTTSDLFGELGQSGIKAGVDITNSFKKITELPIFSGIPGMDKAGPALMRSFASADQARNLQLGLVALASASGNLNSVLEATGANFAGLSDYTANYNEMINNTATSSGMLSTTIQNYASNLARIPGALEETIKSTQSTSGSLTMLDASIKVASAFQIEHKDIVDQLNYSYRNFNTTGDKALEFVANMAQTAQNLHMPLDIVRETTMRAASSFKLMGDNSAAAVNIISKVGGALKDSIGAEGIAEITTSMIDGIGKMDIATKSFISGASGGRGGLAGAFQIDMLMQQGKMDQVLQMTMSAMQKQFKGPVLTLDDAANNPAQSGEFLKQVSFLKDVAGIANTDKQAYRILELMKKGGVGTGEELAKMRATPEENLQGALDRGASVQEQGFSRLVDISNQLLRVQQVSAAASLSLNQRLIGTEGEGGIDMITKMKEAGGTASNRVNVTAADQQDMVLGSIKDTLAIVTKFGSEMVGKVQSSVNPDQPATNVNNLTTTEIVNNSTSQLANQPNQAVAGLAQNIFGPAPQIKPTTGGPASAEAIMAIPVTDAKTGSRGAGKGASDVAAGNSQMPGGGMPIEGNINITVDVKDGVTTIAKAVSRQEIKDIFGSINGINKRSP